MDIDEYMEHKWSPWDEVDFDDIPGCLRCGVVDGSLVTIYIEHTGPDGECVVERGDCKFCGLKWRDTMVLDNSAAVDLRPVCPTCDTCEDVTYDGDTYCANCGDYCFEEGD